jgi:heterodisulfide reductase subunit A
MAGIRPSASGRRVGDMLHLMNEEDGFFSTKDSIYSQQKSDIPGLFFAGAGTGPKTIPETLNDARSSALEIDSYLKSNFPKKK